MTTLTPRRRALEIPTYSLTGDLLAFHRCGLQYRYQNRGRLPPSTPVQLWAGAFLHGVMEEAFLSWSQDKPGGKFRTLPWSYEQSLELQILVNNTRLRPLNILAPGNQFSEDPASPKVANMRAFEAVNCWGPFLFPLVARAEVPLQGVRPMPAGAQGRSDLYEVNGVVDVLVSASLASHGTNPIVQAIVQELGQIAGDFEIIVDYKGSDRPPAGSEFERVWRWQLETYAWLRSMQEDAKPVHAGVLICLNELVPSADALKGLAEAAALGKPIANANAADLHALRNYRGGPPPSLSPEFRRARSLMVFPINPQEVATGGSRFDETVKAIETAVAAEMGGNPIHAAWTAPWAALPNADGSARQAPDKGTCSACDHLTYCRLAKDKHGDSMIAVPDPS